MFQFQNDPYTDFKMLEKGMMLGIRYVYIENELFLILQRAIKHTNKIIMFVLFVICGDRREIENSKIRVNLSIRHCN